jgi:hypothetical protein
LTKTAAAAVQQLQAMVELILLQQAKASQQQVKHHATNH